MVVAFSATYYAGNPGPKRIFAGTFAEYTYQVGLFNLDPAGTVAYKAVGYR
jgi:hypothetical protein